MERKLNLQRAPRDERDKQFKCIKPISAHALPAVADLRKEDPGCFDQLEIGSCVYNVYARLHDFLRKKALSFKGVFKDSARLYGYNIGRKLQGTFSEDSGTDMRTGGVVMNTYGTVPESQFPYDNKHLYVYPSEQLIVEGKTHTNPTFYACETINEVRECLADGYPVAIGFDVPKAFMDDTMADTGEMSDSDWRSESDGGHAVLLMGYDFSIPGQEFFWVKNSWGLDWGLKGHFKMPAWVLESQAAFNKYTMRID